VDNGHCFKNVSHLQRWVTVLNSNESDSLALPPGLTKDKAKSLLQRLRGRRDERKFLLWKVQEFRSFVRVIIAMWLLRWPGGPIIWPLCCYVFRKDFQFVVNSQEHDFRVPPPTKSNFTLGMFFLSSFHFQCFCWIFAFHTCNLLHDLDAGWITSNDFEVCINFNFYCSGYCQCQLFVIRCVFHLRYKQY